VAEQDRGAWNRQHIDEGIALITGALSRTPLGPYQLQGAIAAVHDEAAHVEDTPWSRYLNRFADRGASEHPPEAESGNVPSNRVLS
jgi:predicted RNA polymerase sigma factor